MKTARALVGFTLIEVMIAMTLGLLLMGVIATVFLSSSRNYAQDDRISRLQENGRFALKTLAHELSMVDFWGGMSVPSNIVANPNVQPASAAGRCGLTYDAANSVIVLNAAAAATANGQFGCIATAEFQANTDVFAIKRAYGFEQTYPTGSTEDAVLTDAPIYLRTPATAGELRAPVTGASTDGLSYWRFMPSIYYIRNRFQETTAGVAADSIPTLFRKRLNAAREMATEEGGVAEGIENFRIEFGVDSDSDGVANNYTIAPTNFMQVVTARVYVLVRSRDKDMAFTDSKRYNLGATLCYNAAASDGCLAYPDGPNYYRQVLSSTVALRNPANVARFAP